MNKLAKRDISQEYENNRRMNDPGIKMNIGPRQGNPPKYAGDDQSYKRKIGLKGHGQDSHPKALKEKSRDDNQEKKQNGYEIFPLRDHVGTFDRPTNEGGDRSAEDEES